MAVREPRTRNKKEEDTQSRLEKENRELKAQVRALTKRLKKVSKGKTRNTKEKYEEFEEIPETKPDCTECGKGYLVYTTIGPRRQLGCNLCDYRGKFEKIK